jgi:hypothetical protein
MHMNIHHKTYLLAGVIALVLLAGCKKDDTYYNYDKETSVFDGNSYQYLQKGGGLFDSMLLVIDRCTGLKDSLVSGKVTLFAINNNSFNLAMRNLNLRRATMAPARPPLSLATLDSTQLDTLACRYILNGLYATERVVDNADGIQAPTIKYEYQMNLLYERVNAAGYEGGGPQQLFFSDPKQTPFEVFWVTTKTQIVNVKTTNGIVHVLSSGHDFGFGNEFVERMNR